ncbi:uncharacterized protein [Nicotiana sylvestris]|uniref:uncharacterized protein n=1 Tax=Nicotiana sylvestris TaxID=4096 RepID=UPI00388C99C0
MTKQAKDFKAETEHYYVAMSQLENDLQQLQEQNHTAEQTLEARAQQIGRLLQENGIIRERVRRIADYITIKCIKREDTTRSMFFAIVMTFVCQIMEDLYHLQGDLMPKFDLYDGQGYPVVHLRGFCSKMRGAGGKEELLMAYFILSLSGTALEWYTRHDHSRWYTWDYLAQAFACHFQYNLEIILDHLSLTKIEKKPSESFREYGFCWREQAGRVNPPMKEREMVDYFLQDLEPTYYDHLVSAIGKSFNEVVKMGGMVEEGLKSNKIMSYSDIKATTQAIQNGTRGVIKKKKKEDVATIDSGSWLRQLDMLKMIESKLPNPPPKNLDYSISCEYCSGTLGHDTEKCWNLKNVIQELIDTNRIEFQTPEAPNINQNPLPTHQEKNMIEIVHKGGEPKKASQTVIMIRSSEVKLVKKLTVEGSVNKLSETNGEPSVVVKKGSPSDVAAKQEKPKVVVPGVGKKVKEEVNEAHGLTRSERCFAPEELRKVKTSKDNPVLVKKAVTEEEAEEFLRKMKVLVDNGSSANICPLSTLNKLKVDDERIHKNSIYVRGFDGGGKDSVGDIVLELTIGSVEFTMEFQVLDVAVSYNLLLCRPWIHAAKAVMSTMYLMVKFEWDRQEIVVHGEDNLCAHSDADVPFIEGIIQLVSLPKSLGTFGLGFKPTTVDVKRDRKLKQRAWAFPKPIPCLSRLFVKPGARKLPVTTVPSSVVDIDEELIERFERLFDDLNMVEVGEGYSKADVQFVGPNAKLNN